jgi:hypothetical protein
LEESEACGDSYSAEADAEVDPDVPDRFRGTVDADESGYGSLRPWHKMAAVVVIALVVGVVPFVANFNTIEHWAFPERQAYDTGAEFFHEQNLDMGDSFGVGSDGYIDARGGS